MKIGLLGLGTIGSGIYEHLLNRDDIQVVRILELLRHPGLEHLETSDFDEILNDPQIDTVVELIGGMEPAHTFTVRALKAGKNVVSANKLMLSHHMEEILTLARDMGVQYRYDASVGGSIPFLYNLARYRGVDALRSLWGIVNGTTNLILDVMQREGRAFDDVLAEAQKLGYAEANPSADVDGVDAMCKLCIASAVAYQKYVRPEDVDAEGIRHIRAEDIIFFRQMHKVCRLLVCSSVSPDGSVVAYVEPTLVAEDSTEAAVRMNNNAISVRGEYCGTHTFLGQGAGKHPTAFAVELGLRDIMDGVPKRLSPIPEGYATVDNRQERHAYYLRTSAHPGVPAQKLGEVEGGAAYVTEAMSVRQMHDLARQLREKDPRLFFAGIRDK